MKIVNIFLGVFLLGSMSACNQGNSSQETETPEIAKASVIVRLKTVSGKEEADAIGAWCRKLSGTEFGWAQVMLAHVDSSQIAVIFGKADAENLLKKIAADDFWSTKTYTSEVLNATDGEATPLKTTDLSLMIVHRVKEFAHWEETFTAHRPARTEAGVFIHEIYRAKADSNNLYLVFRSDDLEPIKKLAAQPDMKHVMESSGVINQPELTYWNVNQ